MSNLHWENIEDSRNKGPINPYWNKVFYKQKCGDGEEERVCVLSARYKVYMEEIKNYDVRPDDIWICSYPKSGTTWSQEMVWCINNDYNFELAKQKTLSCRSPTLRKIITTRTEINQPGDFFISDDAKEEINPPYHIKNHLPVGLLPQNIWNVKPKIIYVARHPKDAAISFYHYYCSIYKYSGTKEEFLSLFLDGLTEFGLQTTHIMDFWRLKDEPNILFLTYEEMKSDLKAVINRTVKFLGKTITDKQLEELQKHLHIDSMRENCNVFKVQDNCIHINKDDKQRQTEFFRRGETGSHKDEMSPEISERFNSLIKQELTDKGCDLYKPKENF